MKKLIPLLLLAVMLTAGCIPGCLPAKGQLPVINSFDANPPSISAGESSTLSWNVAGATAVSIDQGIGNVALTGRRAVMPSATTVYTLTATNAAGMSATATTQVIVSGAPSPPTPAGLPVVNSFTASPPGITAGSSATLSWNVSNATSVTIDPGVGTFASSGTTIVSPAATTMYTLTAANAAGSTTSMAQVIVSSGAYTPPPEPTPVPFAVLGVTATVDPSTFTGACPKNFSCSAVITVNGPGTVTYRWERSDLGSSPVQTMTFGAAGSQMVTTGWPRDVSGAYWVSVRTLTPNEVVSNQASFNLTCQQPFAVTSVTASVLPSYSGTCPQNPLFKAKITVNGQGKVKYVWVRSDFGESPEQTVNFEGAGYRWVETGWPRDAGPWGVKVRTLTPNIVVSNEAWTMVTCAATPPPFAVTNVSLSVTPPTYTGPCPSSFTCSVTITVSAPGRVTYQWVRSDGTSAVQIMDFTAAGSKTVTSGWNPPTQYPWVRVRTLSPNVKEYYTSVVNNCLE